MGVRPSCSDEVLDAQHSGEDDEPVSRSSSPLAISATASARSLWRLPGLSQTGNQGTGAVTHPIEFGKRRSKMAAFDIQPEAGHIISSRGSRTQVRNLPSIAIP